MSMKYCRLILTLLLTVVFGTGRAQNEFISHSRLPDEDKIMQLDGQAGFLFYSSSADLVISINNPEHFPLTVEKPRQEKDGRYVYLAKVKILYPDRRDTSFSVSRRGDASKDEFKVNLKADYAQAYLVEAVTNRIVINEQDGARSIATDAQVQIEFTTNVTGLKVEAASGLRSELKRTKSPSGAEIITLNVDYNSLKEVREKYAKTQKAFDSLNHELVDVEAGDKTDEDWKRLDALEKEVQTLGGELAALAQVRIFAPGSNTLTIDISDVKNAEKRNYAVLTMKEEVRVDAIEENKALARKAAAERQFRSAAELYRKALTFKGATHADSVYCSERAARMDTCYQLNTLANGALKKVNEMKRSGKMVDYGLAEECYIVAISNNKSLYAITQDEEFSRRAEKIQEVYQKLGLVIEGRTVSHRLRQGVGVEQPVTGFAIYAVTESFMSKYMERGAHGTLLGHTGADGTFHVQVERGKYQGLLFVPERNGDFKNNTYVSIREQRHLRLDVNIGK